MTIGLHLRVVFIVALATFLCWSAFYHLRPPVIKQCVVAESLSRPECTPGLIMSRDPYCVIDPVCVSPFYRASERNIAPRWQGAATNLLDPSLGGHDGYQAFALVNFGLFVLLAVSVAYLLKLGRARYFHWVAFGLSVWVLLEWLRWTFLTWKLTREFTAENPLGLSTGYVGLVVTAIPLVVVAWISLSRKRSWLP
jgi:hypothetical protein